VTADGLPETVGLVGGGRMGAGIAHALAVAGAHVIVVEIDDAAATAASRRVETHLAKSAERGVVVRGGVQVAIDLAAVHATELVIEAVPELLQTKLDALSQIARAAPAAAIGTNTSSFPIDRLADALDDPARLIGLHFFNPVPASALVEIVVGTRTSPELVERARTWVRALGKAAITVADAPGFASSRLGVTLGLEAIRMLEEGVASADDIDTAMTLGYRHAVGPLRTSDIVGLDVRLAIAEQLERELGPRFAPPELLRSKVAAGELGRKSGKGFYLW
jgi:3-hydroxybutyryl-CoA dehydrogenase